jgi:hypothetical protein
MMPGDLIKIGRVRFKIKEIVSPAYLGMQDKYQKQLINEDYHHVLDLREVGVDAVMKKMNEPTPREEPRRGSQVS